MGNNGHLDIVKLLLAKGANPMARELQAEDMPLHWACVKGHLEIVKVLLTAMTPMMQDTVNSPNKEGMTPLHFAANTGQVEIAEYLCNHKANVDKQDKNGNTPLHLACANLHLNVVDLLVTKYHPSVTIKNTEGKLPEDMNEVYRDSIQAVIKQDEKAEGGQENAMLKSILGSTMS